MPGLRGTCLLALGVCLSTALWLGCISTASQTASKNKKKPAEGPEFASPRDRMLEMRNIAKRAPKMPQEEQEQIVSKALRGLQKETDPLLRAEMLRTLAAVPAATAEPILKAGLKDSDPEVRIASCHAWGQRHTPEAVQVLSDMLSGDSNLDVRLAAARALGQTHDEKAVAALGQALDDSNPAMQYRAVQSLKAVTKRDFGNDVEAWRQYVKTGETKAPESIVSRLRQWF